MMMVLKAATLALALTLLAAGAIRAHGAVPAERAVDDANVARAAGDEEPLAAAVYAPLARTRPAVAVERLDRRPERACDLLRAVRLVPPRVPARAGTFDDELGLDRPVALRLPAAASEVRLDVPLGRVTLYVWADMTSELPRPDCVDGETYFTPGLEVRLARGVRAFLEDLQPASGVLGDAEEDEPAPARSWDGHQVAGGLRWEPRAGLLIEVAAVLPVLSATGRRAAPGALVSITLRL